MGLAESIMFAVSPINETDEVAMWVGTSQHDAIRTALPVHIGTHGAVFWEAPPNTEVHMITRTIKFITLRRWIGNRYLTRREQTLQRAASVGVRMHLPTQSM
jgi:hypothetical protein